MFIDYSLQFKLPIVHTISCIFVHRSVYMFYALFVFVLICNAPVIYYFIHLQHSKYSTVVIYSYYSLVIFQWHIFGGITQIDLLCLMSWSVMVMRCIYVKCNFNGILNPNIWIAMGDLSIDNIMQTSVCSIQWNMSIQKWKIDKPAINFTGLIHWQHKMMFLS